MTIGDVDKNHFLSLAQLARLLPATENGAVNPSTVWRWATKGIRGHRLGTIRVGGRVLTTIEMYESFAAALNSDVTPIPLPAESRSRVGKRIREPAKVLIAAGITAPAQRGKSAVPLRTDPQRSG